MRIKLNIMKTKISIYLLSSLALVFAMTPTNLEAQSQETKKPIKYKKSKGTPDLNC